MRVPMSETKPTLHDIREQQYFDGLTLAERAGVDASVVEHMLAGQPVQRYQAELVLAALADEYSQDYTLETVDIVLLPQEDPEDHA